MDDEHTEFLEELKMEMLEEQREEEELERAAREEDEQVDCGIILNILHGWWWLDVFFMGLLFYI